MVRQCSRVDISGFDSFTSLKLETYYIKHVPYIPLINDIATRLLLQRRTIHPYLHKALNRRNFSIT